MNDQAQRDQALDITQSFIVQAPAGSGKTELLTQRYLKLLSTCSDPENVIAMTFTNKAVDEMTQRVLSALISSNVKRPKEPHKQVTYDLAAKVIKRSDQKNWQLLQNPKRLKISTIDGLSSLITSRYPLESQLVPRQTISDKWARDRAYKYAAQQTLLMIDEQQHGVQIAKLLLYLDNHVEKFYRLVMQMLSKRDQWLTRLYRGDSMSPEVLKQSAKEIIVQYLTQLEQIAKPHLGEEFFALIASSTKKEHEHITKLPSHDIQDLQKWQSIQELCLNKKGKWRKKLDKNTGFPPELKTEKASLLALLDHLSSQEALRECLHQVNTLPDIDFSSTQTDILEAIAQVLKLCVAQLNLYFEREQSQDFIEIALNANQALDDRTGISDIALFLDYKVQHLLIDEFQDTSASQFNTIEKLINQWQMDDGKTLFLVGDPMQSIYRFRESQVGLFLQVRDKGIAGINPRSLVLSTNFRSSKSVVKANNNFFQSIFPDNDDVYQGAISYSPSQSAASDKDSDAVVFHPFSYNQSLSEAQTLSNIVKNALAKNKDDEVAVLVRNRSHLLEIAKQLTQDDIAFESLKITKLKDHLLTRDLFSLTKALLHLGNKLAWLSVLRSPWCGLMLDDLLVLSQDSERVVYEQLIDEEILAKLSADGQKRAKHIYYCLQGVVNNQARFTFVELLSDALNQLGITKSLSSTESIIKSQFLQIVFNAEQQQLLNIEAIEGALEDLYAPSNRASVKLMTIHQSKGLEFDTVIIPGLGKTPRHDDSPIMHMREFSNQSLLIAPIKSSLDSQQSNTYNYLKFIESQQSKFEAMRLLYVAMTRAKKKLHLLGALNQSKTAASNSLLALLMPFYKKSFESVDHTPDVLNQDCDAPQLQRLLNLQAPIDKVQTQGELVEYQQSLERLFKSLLGTLLHQYYEQGLFTPTDENINTRLIEIGIAPSAISQSRAFITRLLNNTKNDKQFDWLFKQRLSTRIEAEFIIGEKLIVIDRLFIEDDTLWIIDFKTAEPTLDETLDQFIKRQQSQHAKQLLFYQDALSKIYDNTIQCALYCPAVSQLIEIKH